MMQNIKDWAGQAWGEVVRYWWAVWAGLCKLCAFLFRPIRIRLFGLTDGNLGEIMAVETPEKREKNAFMPPKYKQRHAMALQALGHGAADPYQQRLALAYVLSTLSGTDDLSFRPDSDRETSFAEGRRFVGLQIMKLLKLNIGNIKDD